MVQKVFGRNTAPNTLAKFAICDTAACGTLCFMGKQLLVDPLNQTEKER